ncbi:STAS domain-containing protein [Methylobacterium sp. WSM2598]|uniref:STAS domain-containing protein n=1 Tax=Methylobacterium sp. WSM2598 TaxID=398261 RepID=UPI00035DDDFD|nr:STAS domain-containing protein [Methylobacterium sp. WSM2598]
MGRLGQILSAQHEQVLDAWLRRLDAPGETKPGRTTSPGLLRVELAALLRALTDAFLAGEGGVSGEPFAAIEAQATAMSAARARDGFTPMETASLLMSLKDAAAEVVRREAGAGPEHPAEILAPFGAAVDRLALVTFAAFVETRERLIERQSRALLDLATPALPIWQRIMLMPLVGIIDTQRARQIMERLLDALGREEASIAILDVTGVPVIDSRVALHLTRTVEAARLLGARVVVTGISPDAAQTLVKLDVTLTSMITRGTLRAGLAEAFRLLREEVRPNPTEAGL